MRPRTPPRWSTVPSADPTSFQCASSKLSGPNQALGMPRSSRRSRTTCHQLGVTCFFLFSSGACVFFCLAADNLANSLAATSFMFVEDPRFEKKHLPTPQLSLGTNHPFAAKHLRRCLLVVSGRISEGLRRQRRLGRGFLQRPGAFSWSTDYE